MKITIKLPGGGYIRYEKEPMGEDERFAVLTSVGLFALFALFVLASLISG